MRKYLFILFLMIALSGCSKGTATPTPTRPPSAAEISLTMLADQVNAQATQSKFESILQVTQQVANATSTQQMVFVYGTATQQARNDAQATAQQELRFIQATQARIDADATQEQARRDMVSTQEQARLDLIATQQAAGTATTFAITMTAIPPANTMTAIANNQQIALADDNVKMSNLAVEKQSQTNTPSWVLTYSVIIAAMLVGAVYFVRQSRVREVKNEDGNIELVIFDGRRAVRPALLPGPVLEMDKDNISMPLLTATSAEQARVTERAQAVEAIRAMPQAANPSSAGAFNKYFGSNQELPFDVIDAEDSPPAGLIDGQALNALNKDWKEAKDEQ